jgi:isoquinoline 1-oxidoreductase beta subunit
MMNTPAPNGVSRRRFIGYLIAGSTLIAAASLDRPNDADASIPTVQPVDDYDLSDLLTDAATPTSGLITVIVNTDGTVAFSLPRAEVGQGITTAVAMTIADELGVALSKVSISLSDARSELVFNQLTGGSNTMHSIYTPVRTAAGAARDQMTSAAARELGVTRDRLTISDGRVIADDGRSIDFGTLATKAAVTVSRTVPVTLKDVSAQSIVGTSQGRIDAHDIVTGKKVFAMDMEIPGALPTMVCRPPGINGTALAIRNQKQVAAMPGVTDVVLIPHTLYVPGGVAVRAATFGQCIDAVRALSVEWGSGSADAKSDATVLADLQANEHALSPAVPGLETLEQVFTFYFRPGDPLETNCAIADVSGGKAEIWSSLKSPIYAQQQIAANLGMAESDVTVHVTQGGGSFGRHLFADAAFEAAAISAKLGKPVKLMWARTDNFRQGRTKPMAIDRVRLSYSGSNVVAYDQQHTSVATDFSHGFGEIITAMAATIPGGDTGGYSNTIFDLTQSVPYNFGVVGQSLSEIYDIDAFNTSSTRNIYSPDVVTATELMTDQLGVKLGMDPLAVRRAFVRDDRMMAVLGTVADAGNWGRKMAPGTAQAIGIHSEYKGRGACLVEIDCRPATVNRKVKYGGFTGPRVTKVVFAVDVGLPINPLGLEAQMMGGAMDGIANALTYSLHLENGYFLEGSWDNAYYTREWNVPDDVEVIVMPATSDTPGGAGELGVAPTMAAVACAYARATGKLPTSFPINHFEPLGFTPYPTVPPIPQSITNGLAIAGVRKGKK